MNEITQLISAVGFPIAACAAMAYYVKYVFDANRKQLQTITESHENEVKELRDTMVVALENNTKALVELSTMMKGGIKDEVK